MKKKIRNRDKERGEMKKDPSRKTREKKRNEK
jgi:hypothetical protein